MSEKALIIGGHGFIGYHISKQLSDNGLKVTIAHRSKELKQQSDHKLVYLDLELISDAKLKDMVLEYAYIIFCGGADDRTTPEGNAESFYYNANVLPCIKLAKASLASNIKKIIILGSYFSYFDRLNPGWHLKEKHPYIMSRHLQYTKTTEVVKNKIDICTIEIPYVFGSTPDKTPLWKPLISYINKMPIVFYTKGGTNIMDVGQVAKAIMGVINSKKHQPHWIIGSENVSWTKLIEMISIGLGKKRKVILIPNIIVRIIALVVKAYFSIFNKQPGLDPYHFIEVQTLNTFLNLSNSMKDLDYSKVNMQESINQTVMACGKLE